ncbi:MAG: hypothetical protein K2P93_02975 [Alphaproteobacteria bacterium]|nr:hypothetical protein [Alphaproteobacteria bacterium]
MSTPSDPKDSKNPNIHSAHIDSHTLKVSDPHSSTLKATDIVALIQNHGKVVLHGKEIVLMDPSSTDPRLKVMINEPTLSLMPIGKTPENGEGEYELRSSKRLVKLKLRIQNV